MMKRAAVAALALLALPAAAQAELTHDDVRELLTWHLEEFRARGLRPRYEGAAPPELVVLDDESMLDLLVEKALTSGRDLDPVHVAAVLDRHLQHLERIGAIASTPAPPEELEGGAGPP